MDFLELVTGARTCRRFREAEGLPAGTFAETALQDGDSLELLQFVGGG